MFIALPFEYFYIRRISKYMCNKRTKTAKESRKVDCGESVGNKIPTVLIKFLKQPVL